MLNLLAALLLFIIVYGLLQEGGRRWYHYLQSDTLSAKIWRSILS